MTSKEKNKEEGKQFTCNMWTLKTMWMRKKTVNNKNLRNVSIKIKIGSVSSSHTVSNENQSNFKSLP